MNTIKIWNDNPSSKQIQDIVDCLEDGKIAIIPTDTMYAIVGNALDSSAVERICRLKGINPQKTNLSILCSNISMASEYARIDNTGFKFLKENTPGPFTVIFKSASNLPKAFKNRKMVGIRIPDSNIALKIVDGLGYPLLTTTIQYEDEDYAVNPDLIAESYDGKVDLMVDGGTGNIKQSSVLDCSSGSLEFIRE